MHHRLVALAALVASLMLTGALAGCSGEAPRTDQIIVTVSILPQKYFVERIGGDRVQVNVMVGPGADPHSYEPKPQQMRALSQSAAYFSIGIDFEKAWLERFAAANDKMVMVDTVAHIQRLPLTNPLSGAGQSAGGEPDPHVWLSPELVKVQSQAIYDALVGIDPGHKAAYQANLDALMADIDRLEADIRETLKGVQNRKFMVFHPAWGYLAHDFGLEQISIEVGGQEPSAQELAALIAEAKQEGIRVVFAEPQFSTRTAETIAGEIGGRVLLIDDLAEDWLTNMRTVAKTFAEVMG
jgi:zinc transport system substrate-binding protein